MMVENTAPLSQNQLFDYIRSLILVEQRENNAFYVLDLGVVDSLFNTWSFNFPVIQPFYAVKCNPHVPFLKRLAELGTGFDCASYAEIQTVLSIGVPPNRIIFANTCKPDSHIKYAAEVGVNLTTFDSESELEKMKRLHPTCELLIRIRVPDLRAVSDPHDAKFGALPDEIAPLLRTARALGLNIVGVSFHIGSGAVDFGAFEEAIAAAKSAFEIATQVGFPEMRILDIGAGFNSGSRFIGAALAVKRALKKNFPDREALRILAEPGRYFARSPFTLVTCIMGKRVRGDVREYWIDDGIFGSMCCLKSDQGHDELKLTPLVLRGSARLGTMTYRSTIFGPTCHPLDVVSRGYKLPDLEVNDWLVFHNMGAYTSAAGTDFNGFKTSAIPTYAAQSSRSG
nr:PREDICTED: ornithine decarboxylase-like [Bemisia tabaci]